MARGLIAGVINRDGLHRTGHHARAATVADGGLYLRLRDTARGETEPDGAGLALFATDAALHALVREALRRHAGLDLPWGALRRADQRAFGAAAGAIAAEAARAVLETNLGITAAALGNQAVGAGGNAFAAAIAVFEELGFGTRPGRTHDGLPAAKVAAQKLTSAGIHHRLCHAPGVNN